MYLRFEGNFNLIFLHSLFSLRPPKYFYLDRKKRKHKITKYKFYYSLLPQQTILLLTFITPTSYKRPSVLTKPPQQLCYSQLN